MLKLKLVREHINELNFQRGLDPKEAMNIGLTPEERIKLKQKIPVLKRPSPFLGKIGHNKIYSRGYILWKLLDFIDKGEKTGGRRHKELVKEYLGSKGKLGFSSGLFNSLTFYTKYDVVPTDKKPGARSTHYGHINTTYQLGDTKKRVRPNNRYFLNERGKRFLEKYRDAFETQLTESNFQRGLDPKEAMGTGVYSPRIFKTTKEFINYIMPVLPTIFGSKIPDDILSRKEAGMLPQSIYLTIRDFLKKCGHKTIDGTGNLVNAFSNDDESTAGILTFWPGLIKTELEKLGYTRTNDYPELGI